MIENTEGSPTMVETIKVTVEDKEIVFRRPKHEELDLALMGRMFNQFVGHKLEADDVKGGPGAALKIDDLNLKMEDCLKVIVARFREMLKNCATIVAGESAKAEDFPELDGDNAGWWSEVAQQVFLALMEVAAPGKSEGAPLSVV
jgi:hypothetical protein